VSFGDPVVVGFRLLGPVEVRAGACWVGVGPPRQCAVFAALAVDAGRLVPTAVVVDRVWGEQPPDGVRRTLHTYITRIRHVVEQVGVGGGRPARVAWRSGGYLLDTDPDRVDLHRFGRLVEQARGQTLAQDALGLLREAVRLWQGEPLTGVPGEWAARMRQSWRQDQVAAVCAWADAELRAGDPAAVLGPVRELAELYPLAEPLTAALMRAHAASGRAAEALASYDAARRRLADELGADPGPELRAVHQALLRGELHPAAAAPAAQPVPAPVPAQLPTDLPGFAGRAAELAQLDRMLAAAPAEHAIATVISAVSGTAGVGKTALAVHWSHRVADRFPDGQLYVNLRGFDPGGQVMEPARAVRGFLDALGVPAQRIPADPDAQAALYRSLLAGRRMLIVVDNARDAEHARPLLPGTATALAVVTSRDQLTPLVAADGAHPLTLDLLTHDEARELLARRIDPVRLTAEPQAVEQIIAACARLPLALALVAARAATHPSFPLAALATELAAAGDRTARLDAGDILSQVQGVFSWSYTTLTPPAARLFRLLGLHPGPDITAPAAASLTGRPPAQARPLLAELTRAGLLAEPAPGRYGFHDLLRAYATRLTESVDTDQDRAAATVRLLDHYTHTAHAADRHLDPTRDPIRIPLTPSVAGATREQPTDQETALRWLDAERPVLLAAQQVAVAAGRDGHAWQLAWVLTTVLQRRGHWQDLAAAWQTALAAADRLGDLSASGYAHGMLAMAGILQGDYGKADTHLHHALDLFVEAGDPVEQAHTHIQLGYLWDRQDQPDRAVDHAQQALTLYQAAGHRRGQADALNAVGWCHVRRGDYTQALTCCQQALTLNQQLGDRAGEAATWDSLGYAHQHLDHHTEAADCYQHALTRYRDLGDRYYEADTLSHLGDTHHAAGRPDQARTAWSTALHILTDLDHPDAAAVGAKLSTLNGAPGRTATSVAKAAPT
jgi:DNA-binding SARP family transcriptional activator/Tfp pilus assembly protein PilF